MKAATERPTSASRRRLLADAGTGALVLCVPAAAALAASPGLEDALRRGGCALLLRHARTVSGVGDPPGFRLGDCGTQRNLSDEGREQARTLGAWFRARSLTPAAVRSSRWCRCLDTATLAFGRADPWSALDSFFDERASEPTQTRALAAALPAIARERFEVWVTHMVNIAALTGETVASGEAVLAQAPRAGSGPAPQVLGRLLL